MSTCKHSQVSKYCSKCGEVINPDAKVNPNCSNHHEEYKEWNYKNCPDCGKSL